MCTILPVLKTNEGVELQLPNCLISPPPAKLWRPDREETREGLHTYTVGMYSHGKALVVYDISMQVFPTALDLKESS